MNYTKNYLKRNNPIKLFKRELVAGLKDALSINKKRKMVKYKLKYQLHQLSQMEKLIAENTPMYLRVLPGCTLRKVLRVIRLASEAMGVPRPPMFTAINRLL